MAKSKAARSAPVCPPEMIFLSMGLPLLVLGLDLFEFLKEPLLRDQTLFHQQLYQSIDLDAGGHQEFLEGHEFVFRQGFGHLVPILLLS
jgi:hypothetical protein